MTVDWLAVIVTAWILAGAAVGMAVGHVFRAQYRQDRADLARIKRSKR